MQANIATLQTVYTKIKELNRQNDLLRHKYGGDAKYARIHKRLMENAALYGDKLKVFNALNGVKTDADQRVLDMEQILDNQNYFEKQMQGIVLKRFRTEQQFPVQPADIQTINRLLVREYLKESGRIWEVDFQVALTIYRYRKAMHNNDIIIYTTEDGLSEFTLRELDGELWLAQKKLPNSTKPANKTSVNTSKPYLQNKNWTIQL